jgi:hypothetical protein
VDESSASRSTCRLAVASVVAALAFPLWPLSSITAIVLGWLAIRRIEQSPGLKGQALAVVGMAIGTVVVLAGLLLLAAVIFVGYSCRRGC